MEGSRITPDNPSSSRKDKNQNIQVFVRVRPMNQTEITKHCPEVIDTPGSKEVVVRERPGTSLTKTFTFDKVFGKKSKQVDVYKDVVAPLLSEVLLGYNCTVFAYGQTGTGKTFTMEGERYQKPAVDMGIFEHDPRAGILPRALSQLFDEVRMMNCEFSVRVSFLELYNEELFDLLAIDDARQKTLRLYEDSNRKGSVIIQGLEEVIVNNKHEVYSVLDRGTQLRKTAATLMNASSSRSHTIFTITVHMKESSVEGEEMVKIGKLHLVDLAGSENIGKSGAIDKRAREAGSINQSLLTLGRVITALVERTPHIPYRESKLTRLLQDSLGGKTKTSIIATVSPASFNLEETLSTLDYAHRAKNIMNRPEVNQRLTKKEVLNIYTDEIERLRRDLIATREKNGIYMNEDHYNYITIQIKAQIDEINEKSIRIKEMEQTISLQDIELLEVAGVNQELREDVRIKGKMNEELNARVAALQSKLTKAEIVSDELKHLVNTHVDTEEKLSGEANILLDTTKDSVSIIDTLYSRLDRKQAVEDKNLKSAARFREEFRHSISGMCDTLSSLRKIHVLYTTSLHDSSATLGTKRQTHLASFKDSFKSIVGEISATVAKIDDATMQLIGNVESNVSSEKLILSEVSASSRQRYDEIKNEMMEVVVAVKKNMGNLKGEIKKLKVDVEKKYGVMEAKVMETLQVDINTFNGLEVLMNDLTTKMAEMMENVDGYSRSFEIVQQKHKDGFEKRLAEMQNSLAAFSNETKEYFALAENSQTDFAQNFKTIHLDCKTALVKETGSLRKSKEIPQSAMTSIAQHRQENIVEHQNHLDKIYEKMDHVVVSSRKLEKKLGDVNKISDTLISEVFGAVGKTAQQHVSQANVHYNALKKNVDYVNRSIGHVKKSVCDEFQRLVIEDQGASTDRIEAADDHCDDISDHVTNLTKAVQQSAGSVEEFWEGTYLIDLPSGATPMKPKYDYPLKLSSTSPHERVIARYRSVKIDVDSAIKDYCTSGENGLYNLQQELLTVIEENEENVEPPYIVSSDSDTKVDSHEVNSNGDGKCTNNGITSSSAESCNGKSKNLSVKKLGKSKRKSNGKKGPLKLSN